MNAIVDASKRIILTSLLILAAFGDLQAKAPNPFEISPRIQQRDPSVLPVAKQLLWGEDKYAFNIISCALIYSKWKEADDLLNEYLLKSSDVDGLTAITLHINHLPSADQFKEALMGLASNYSEERSSLVASSIRALSKVSGADVDQLLLKISREKTDFDVCHQALSVLSKRNPELYQQTIADFSKAGKMGAGFLDHHQQQTKREAAYARELEKRFAKKEVKPLSAKEKEDFIRSIRAEASKNLEATITKVGTYFKDDKNLFEHLKGQYRETKDVRWKDDLQLLMFTTSENLCEQFIKEEYKNNPDDLKKVTEFNRNRFKQLRQK